MLALFLKSSTNPMTMILARISKTGVEVIDAIDAEEITNGKSSSMLLYGIDKLLEANNVGYDKLDALYVASGPGSYTGARMLMAIVKTIAYIYPTITVFDASLLTIYDAMSKQINDTNHLAVAFARRNKYYVAGTINGHVHQPAVIDTVELEALLLNKPVINGQLSDEEIPIDVLVATALDVTIWWEVSVQVEDTSLYEPYYLEAVKIG